MVLLANNFDAFIKLVKQTVIDTTNASKPVHVVYGTVKSTNPLEIVLEMNEIIPQEMLVLTRNVTDYNVEMTVDHKTEKKSGGSGYSAYESHLHEYVGRKTFLVHKSLQKGEKVVMARVQGGQKFVILDRVVSI